MYYTRSTECSCTHGSHSVCAIRTPLGVDWKILSIRKESMLNVFSLEMLRASCLMSGRLLLSCPPHCPLPYITRIHYSTLREERPRKAKKLPPTKFVYSSLTPPHSLNTPYASYRKRRLWRSTSLTIPKPRGVLLY